MAFRGLERFVSKLPGVIDKVDLEIELLSNRRLNSEPPLLLIDLFSLHNIISQDQRLLLCGGNTAYATRIIQQCFDRLNKFKPRFVFFNSYYTPDEEAESWCQKSDAKYKKRMAIMEMIHKGKTLDEIFTTCRHVLRSDFLWLLIPIIESVASKYGEIITVPDVHSAMVKYANENKAFAVLGNVSNHLVSSAEGQIWNAYRLHRDLTCEAIQRKKFQIFLGLKPEQMPIFGTLYATKMAENPSQVVNEKMVLGLAAVVKTLPLEPSEEDWLKVAEDLFESPEEAWPNLVEKYDEITKPFIRMLPVLDPFMRKIQQNHNPIVYQILEHKFTFLALTYMDLSKEDMCNIAEMFVELRRKEMGILSYHIKEQKPNYTLVSKIAHDEPFTPYEVEPIYPEVTVPLIDQLLFSSEKRNSELESQKYTLIAWYISKSLDVAKINTIPKEFLLTSLAMLYMVEHECIKPKEADVFILTVFQLEKGFRELIPPPQKLNDRAFRLSFIYFKVYEQFIRLFGMVGLKHLSVELKFNGYLFHRNYTKMMNAGKEAALEMMAKVPGYLSLY